MVNFIEVCSGCGGLSLGFIKAGFTPVLLNEIDKICCNTLRQNHPEVQVVCSDMNSLELSQYKRKIDILMGGVPCQSFSQAGLRKGLDDIRGDLILTFKKHVDQVEPKVFLIENVKGLKTHDKGRTLQKVVEKLQEGDKYTIQYTLMNSNDYEVPQNRERIILIGIHKDIVTPYHFPRGIDNKIVLKHVLTNCPSAEGITYTDKKKAVMELVPQGGCWVDLPEEIKKMYMGNSLLSAGGKRGIARRLSMNEPCLTLMTSPCQNQTERCHPIETRPLNILEYSRIQTFPDSYIFAGSINQKYKQIGNAVPVMMAYHIAMSLLPLFV